MRRAIFPVCGNSVGEVPDAAYQTPGFLADALLTAWLIGSAVMAGHSAHTTVGNVELLRDAETAPFVLVAASASRSGPIGRATAADRGLEAAVQPDDLLRGASVLGVADEHDEDRSG